MRKGEKTKLREDCHSFEKQRPQQGPKPWMMDYRSDEIQLDACGMTLQSAQIWIWAPDFGVAF
jgi:hypothetical protein